MTAYPDIDKLIGYLTLVHGELTPEEKALAFLAYSLGGAEAVMYLSERQAEKDREEINP